MLDAELCVYVCLAWERRLLAALRSRLLPPLPPLKASLGTMASLGKHHRATCSPNDPLEDRPPKGSIRGTNKTLFLLKMVNK